MGKKVFAGVIKDQELILDNPMGPKSRDWCPYRRRRGQRGREEGRGDAEPQRIAHVWTAAETGAKHLQAKATQDGAAPGS